MTEIRSYRRVFDLERRIYSVDQLRLNPSGVPVRGVAYFLALLLVCLIVAELPLLGGLVAEVPWYVRDIACPTGAATVLGALRIEGRPFHHAALSALRHAVQPRTLAGVRGAASAGTRFYPREMLLVPDGSDASMRRLRYSGPGAVLVCVEHERRGRAVEHGAVARARRGPGAALRLVPVRGGRALDPGRVIALAPGARMRVERHGARRWSARPWR